MKIFTFIAFVITVYVILKVTIRNSTTAKLVTLAFCALNMIRVLGTSFIDVTKFFSDPLLEALAITTSPGNSARFIRSSICVIAPALVLIVYKFIGYMILKFNIKSVDMRVLGFIAPGIVASLSILYSNDYGISSAIIMFIMSFVILIKLHWGNIKNIRLSLTIMLVSFFASLAILLLVLTKGDPKAYFDTTIAVGQWQRWYAIHDPSGYAYYVWDIIAKESYVSLALLLIVAYAFKLFHQKITMESYIRYGIPCVILSTAYFVIHLYRISDGGGREYFLVVLFTICLGEFINLIKLANILPKLHMKLVVYLVCVSVLGSQFLTFTVNTANDRAEGKYIETLGGFLSADRGATVERTKNKLNGERTFNTYASAVEVVTNQYQPSGTDYIIHVFGDEQRKNYVQSFKESNPKYVGIMSKFFYDDWEGYIRSINWFFYREFLSNYAISFANDYQHYFCKVSEDQKSNIPCMIEKDQKNNSNQYTIKLNFGDERINGIADLKIEYELDKIVRKKNLFLFKTILHLHDIDNKNAVKEDFCLPGGSSSFSIPVKIKNGVGEISLTAFPNQSTRLDLNAVQYEGIFLNPLDIAIVEETRKDDKVDIIKVRGIDEQILKKVVKIQHENKYADVENCYSDSTGVYCVIKHDEPFFLH